MQPLSSCSSQSMRVNIPLRNNYPDEVLIRECLLAMTRRKSYSSLGGPGRFPQGLAKWAEISKVQRSQSKRKIRRNSMCQVPNSERTLMNMRNWEEIFVKGAGWHGGQWQKTENLGGNQRQVLLSQCEPQISTATSPRKVLEMRLIRLHPSRKGPGTYILITSPGESDAPSSFRTLGFFKHLCID